MWISRDKFETMEKQIRRLFKETDMLNMQLKSLKRVSKYASDEPTFRVEKNYEDKDARFQDDGIVEWPRSTQFPYAIYLYINKQEYIIDASEIDDEWIIDYSRSTLKIVEGFAYIDIFAKYECGDFLFYRVYHYISKYADGTKMCDVEDILKRDTMEEYKKRAYNMSAMEIKKYEREAKVEDPYRFHDLRKDPTDLPEKYGEDWVLVKIGCTGTDGKPILAEYRNGKWFSDSDREMPIDDWTMVLGWFKIYDPCLDRKDD